MTYFTVFLVTRVTEAFVVEPQLVNIVLTDHLATSQVTRGHSCTSANSVIRSKYNVMIIKKC